MRFIIVNVITLCLGIAVGNALAYLPKSSLKPGDCVRKLGQPLTGKVHIVSKDTIELYYEMSNDQIMFDIATLDAVVKVECLK